MNPRTNREAKMEKSEYKPDKAMSRSGLFSRLFPTTPDFRLSAAFIAILLGGGLIAPAAEILPLEFHQNDIPVNYQSVRGVPISTTVNASIGSDGRQPTVNQSQGSLNPATTNQFRGFMALGATIAAPDRAAIGSSTILNAGTNAFSGLVAQQMQLPVGLSNGVVSIVMRRAQIGAPYLSRQVSFLFGSVIPVPEMDENGQLLTNIVKEAYWLAEPYTTNAHANAPYYWSPHARQVYAIQPGPISIRWVKAASTTTQPSGYATNATNFYLTGGNYFRISSASYVVSGSAVKPARKIYWTEKTFQNIGKLVSIPPARVGAVNIVYNGGFPKTVSSEYIAPGQTSPADGTTNSVLPELRTLWYDQQQGNIHAYNIEGRVFTELLGDLRADGQSRVQLGFEIVDVYKQVNPADVVTELGEQVLPPPPGSTTNLFPEPVLQIGTTYAYRHVIAGSDKIQYFATRETQNLNDYMVHWMEEGEVGLRWPAVFSRYRMVWPTDVNKYSHYVRPLVATENEAKLTAIPLPTQNVPLLEYQDALDRPRAKLTDDFKFYTFLEPSYPAHRTLFRFTSGENVAFERVFSWLDANLKSTNFSSSIATNLASWNSTNRTFNFPSEFQAPRVVNQTANVGQRILAPNGEIGATGETYTAGHIREVAGTSYDVNAYKDPFAEGFEPANKGAIIPVNVIPGANKLEVWWFRKNSADLEKGFQSIYWPSTIGRYTLQWPSSPREIVLASNRGGGSPIDSLEANGTIYYQNNSNLAGYNPNEEHAIMSAGTAYALRDDLNITNSTGYSSHPYVLVQYTAADNRPAMSVFKVLREKPEEGVVFDYVVEAGKILQPPMPIGLMAKPTEGSGDSTVNYNREPSHEGGDLPGQWNPSLHTNGAYSHYTSFTYRDRNQGFWVYRGLHSGLPELKAGTYDFASDSFYALSDATAVVGQSFSYAVHVSRQSEYLSMAVDASTPLPAWLKVSGLSLVSVLAPENDDIGTNTFQLIVSDLYDGHRVTNSLTINVAESGPVLAQTALQILSTNHYTHSISILAGRPPFLAKSPTAANSFTMRYYYKTEPSFAWPGIATAPSAGTIVPYLRPVDAGNNTYIGDPASKSTASLEIVYRPVWPVRDPKDSSKPVPTMPYGQTLTLPTAGLPGIRDFKTARIFYQQSIAENLTNESVSAVLHDPTRAKFSPLAAAELNKLPGGVATDLYLGKYYFPNLPPHLADRLYYDTSASEKGSLVFKGEFKNEIVGEKYVLLNVLRGEDLASVKALCPEGDPDNAKWIKLVEGLNTAVETFYENPAVPGTYIPNSGLTVSVKPGDLAEITSDNTAVDSYALSATGPGSGYITILEASGTAFTQQGTPVSMHIFKIGGGLFAGSLKLLPSPNPLNERLTIQHTADLAGRNSEYDYEWKIGAPVDGLPPVPDATMSRYLALTSGDGIPRYTIGGAGIQALVDNYIVMRYRSKDVTHPFYDQWSEWTSPALAEGWIKRVLAGINPFNQRTSDLFNNQVNTDSSILTQAGHRWEGDVALNADTLNNYGLIEIYETVLRRGRSLSIESGINYGPANDALLLAVGYLNDLYMMTGGEAWADAANPTIGIGTKDKTYGDIATALFAFKGQEPSLLEENLALLRGRDDFLLPGVQVAPFYNRLAWNYTRGIDSGEVIYALNYNILDENNDGTVNAADAAELFPQGHGDAYGHYLTALKGYYSLLLNSSFDWVPRIEAVNVLGQGVSVDYQDERKFAAAAAAVARSGRQIFDLTWRKDFQSERSGGWDYMKATRVNTTRQYSNNGVTNNPVRYWGVDHWAARVGQGTYLNWIVGNAILPSIDPNPAHEGIQKIDRTTVPELKEMAVTAEDLQTSMDNAEGGLTPLGLPVGAVAFDINPNQVVGGENGTHFEQVYQRAKVALQNAVAAFDDAKDVTRLMRSEQDSLADFKAGIDKQEQAFNNRLIEIYGTPYPDDVGPGKVFPQGYDGADTIHYVYVDLPEITNSVPDPTEPSVYKLDYQAYPDDWFTKLYTSFNFVTSNTDPNYSNGVHYVEYSIGPHGFFDKPKTWTSKRHSPGKIQQAISELIYARDNLDGLLGDTELWKQQLDRQILMFQASVQTYNDIRDYEETKLILDTTLTAVKFVADVAEKIAEQTKSDIEAVASVTKEALPRDLVIGLASGGDLTSAARALIESSGAVIKETIAWGEVIKFLAVRGLEDSTVIAETMIDFHDIAPLERDEEWRSAVAELGDKYAEVQAAIGDINLAIRVLDDAQRKVASSIAEGERIQQERLIFRQRAAAVVQGFRTRDAAFRLFRNEKLERYKTLFDLSARYTYLAAKAYDYETGLLNTSSGKDFIARIISSCALGVMRNGEPQYAGSNTGDPGLSSVLAEMKADWDVLRGRLGFNNPDAYGTTVSLRTENFRILPDTNGLSNWQELLQQSRKDNLLDDADVRRYCMQIDPGNGTAVPGLVLEFSTTIANGYNLFGQPLAAGDHAFSASSFATKIFGVGTALEGYRGMDNPAANTSGVGSAGGSSPSDPTSWYLDPLAMSATPYVYLIPVGEDVMRTPPLGDTSTIRNWTVNDVAIPLPFNIGASDFSTKGIYQSGDSLTEALFALRKHQAFRPVSSPSFFSTSLYGPSGTLQRSQYTNNRLVGRSVWNTKWKLVIPGYTLLNNPKEGLDRFTQTVTDIKVHFVTYSYAGN